MHAHTLNTHTHNTQGRWILIEDMDLAPLEILASLVPLLESRRLYIAARDACVHAMPGETGRRLMVKGGGIPAGGPAHLRKMWVSRSSIHLQNSVIACSRGESSSFSHSFQHRILVISFVDTLQRKALIFCFWPYVGS